MIKPPPPQTFNGFDFFVIFTILISGFLSYTRGFTRTALGLAVWTIATGSTGKIAPLTEPFFGSIFSSQIAVFLASHTCCFVLLLFGGMLIAKSITETVRQSSLSGLDRSLGVPIGFARGAIISVLVYTIYFVAVHPDDHAKVIREAKLKPLLDQGMQVLDHFYELPKHEKRKKKKGEDAAEEEADEEGTPEKPSKPKADEVEKPTTPKSTTSMMIKRALKDDHVQEHLANSLSAMIQPKPKTEQEKKNAAAYDERARHKLDKLLNKIKTEN